MNKIALLAPALFATIGVAFLLVGLNAEEDIPMFGLTMKPKFAILMGGVGTFAGVAVAIEMLTRKRPRVQSVSRS